MPAADVPASLCSRSLGLIPRDLLLRLHALHPDRYPFLLESSAASLQGINYDVLLAFPGDAIESRAGDARYFLDELDQRWQRERIAPTDHALPFMGGWFVYLSYELATQIEASLTLHIEARQLLAKAVRVPMSIQRRSDTGEAWFVAETDVDSALHMQQVQTDVAAVREQVTWPAAGIETLHEDAPMQFLRSVRAALEHIKAGDIYQANLSRGWTARTSPHAAVTLYAALKANNPAPFAGLARLASDHYLISSSPERLIKVRNGEVSTRPIAGTRPRHEDPDQDRLLFEELHTHPKERAEHIMLLDLERNDLGRICEGGSVMVDEYMSIESYAHVHHIVSNVRGLVRRDVTPGQAIAAVFPGGTITGCPKVRCMQIIAEQEGAPRGAYTGSMGYLNRDGSMDLNILIRTLELQDATLRFRAGAGIVADSNPTRELDETRAKAKGLLRALHGDVS
jgi:anthranilate synthase component I